MFLQIPFGFHDLALIRGLLEAAGFASIRVSPLTLDCRSVSARDFAAGFVRGTPLANDLLARGADFAAVEAAVAAALAGAGGEAPFSCPMKAIVFQAEAGI